jgi:RHS repeat-associated protein
MGTYRESYVYDTVGNILAMRHRGSDPSHPGWTRTYSYQEGGLIEPAITNNRLTSTRVGEGPLETYAYDLHGNITTMAHLPVMRWNYLDRLEATAQQVVNSGTPETTYYVYDALGKRVRKVTERRAVQGQTATRMKERLYVGGIEIYREYGTAKNDIDLERETLHVMDDQQRVALVETRTHGDDGSPSQLSRYQLASHLGSVSLELDEGGRLLSYEEYFPFGSTSYQSVDSAAQTSPKRYRYTRMERDDETGLSYHVARYYASWLGRWVSPDPAGLVDGVDLYAYVRCNPIRFSDISATAGNDEVERFGKRFDETFEQLDQLVREYNTLSEEMDRAVRRSWFYPGEKSVPELTTEISTLNEKFAEVQSRFRYLQDDIKKHNMGGGGLAIVSDSGGGLSIVAAPEGGLSLGSDVGSSSSGIVETPTTLSPQSTSPSSHAVEPPTRPVSRSLGDIYKSAKALEDVSGTLASDARMINRPHVDSGALRKMLAGLIGTGTALTVLIKPAAAVAGPLGDAVEIGLGAKAVADAPPEQRAQVAKEETFGFVGGAGGAALGGLGVGLFCGGTGGWGCLALGVVAVGGGGLIGDQVGRGAARMPPPKYAAGSSEEAKSESQTELDEYCRYFANSIECIGH